MSRPNRHKRHKLSTQPPQISFEDWMRQSPAELPHVSLPYANIPTAPARQAHAKNISILTHLDLFLLDDFDLDTTRRHEGTLAALETQAQLPRKRRALDSEGPHVQNLLLQMLKVDAASLDSFIFQTLTTLNVNLSLDDLYNILYGSHLAPLKVVDRLPYTNRNLLNDVRCILDHFKDSSKLTARFGKSDAYQKSWLVNLNEVLRMFLAIQIMQRIMVEDDTGDETPKLPRLAIYKVYTIVCLKLIYNYPTGSSPAAQQKIILGRSKIGKVIKLVYPKLIAKRLGSRGDSRYHYLNVRWNPAIVDKDIERLQELELADIKEYFESEPTKPADGAPGLVDEPIIPLDSGVPLPFESSSFVTSVDKFPLFPMADGFGDWRSASYDILSPHVPVVCDLEPATLVPGLQQRLAQVLQVVSTSHHLHLFMVYATEILLQVVDPAASMQLIEALKEASCIIPQDTNSPWMLLDLRASLSFASLASRLSRLGEFAHSLASTAPAIVSRTRSVLSSLATRGQELHSSLQVIVYQGFMHTLQGHQFRVEDGEKEGLTQVLDHAHLVSSFIGTKLVLWMESEPGDKIDLLLQFVDESLLTDDLKATYPVSLLKDLLTLILHRMLQGVHAYTKSAYGGEFTYCWHLVSFLQEYIAVLGEIVGLHNAAD